MQVRVPRAVEDDDGGSEVFFAPRQLEPMHSVHLHMGDQPIYGTTVLEDCQRLPAISSGGYGVAQPREEVSREREHQEIVVEEEDGGFRWRASRIADQAGAQQSRSASNRPVGRTVSYPPRVFSFKLSQIKCCGPTERDHLYCIACNWPPGAGG